jgi:rubrerythrin
MISRNFFAKCVAIERTIGAIYANLAAVDCYSAQRRQMWKKLSQDEEGHALDLELAGRIAANDKNLETEVSLTFLEDMQGYLDGLFTKLKGQTLDDADAVKMAVEIETNTMVVHARGAVQFTDKDLQRLFGVLGTYDADHLGGLAQAYQELFNSDPVEMFHAGTTK